MGFDMNSMFERLYGRRWLDDVRKAPLSDLRDRLPPSDREYGGLYERDRGILMTYRQIDSLLCEALKIS